MDVDEFDDQLVCDRQGHPTFLVELWSWHYDASGERRGAVLSTCTLHGCEVGEALAWVQEHRPEPGCFVLYAGTWTNCGFLKTLWLAGETPGCGDRSASASFEVQRGRNRRTVGFAIDSGRASHAWDSATRFRADPPSLTNQTDSCGRPVDGISRSTMSQH